MTHHNSGWGCLMAHTIDGNQAPPCIRCSQCYKYIRPEDMDDECLVEESIALQRRAENARDWDILLMRGIPEEISRQKQLLIQALSVEEGDSAMEEKTITITVEQFARWALEEDMKQERECGFPKEDLIHPEGTTLESLDQQERALYLREAREYFGMTLDNWPVSILAHL